MVLIHIFYVKGIKFGISIISHLVRVSVKRQILKMLIN